MRKIIVALTVVGGLFGAGSATADPTHGHCTAYFNGSQTGQANKRKATAFERFAQTVGENDGVDNNDNDEVDEAGEIASPTDIWTYCTPDGTDDANPKGIGGQPDDPNTELNDGNGKNRRGNG